MGSESQEVEQNFAGVTAAILFDQGYTRDALEKFCERGGKQVRGSWDDTVTHVIADSDDDVTEEFSGRPSLFLQVTSRCFIVDIAWIEACIEKGDLLPEGDFFLFESVILNLRVGSLPARRPPARPRGHLHPIFGVS